jgi:hypothetical protein
MAIVDASSRTNWRPREECRAGEEGSRRTGRIVLPSERMQGGAISGGKVQERLQPYKDKVALHQRNIEAIQKEIANLR